MMNYIINYRFKGLSNQMILKYNYGANDIMLLLINDSAFGDNQTTTEAYYFHMDISTMDLQMIIYFKFSFMKYHHNKDNPDWLNNKNWANPELWEK